MLNFNNWFEYLFLSLKIQIPSFRKPANVWMFFTATLVPGTDIEGVNGTPVQINFWDFASAGNTWNEDSRFKVWLRQTIIVMKTESIYF